MTIEAVASSPANAVVIEDLTKVYASRGQPPKTALDAVSLVVPRGSFFGLLGPNGAGKSTLINVLAGLTTKTSGRVVVWGFDIDRDPRHARAAIGAVPQELMIDPFFTPREALDIQAGYYGVPSAERRTAEILEAVGLTSVGDSYARQLSGGMRRRLMVAKALVHAPPILVLDEPTAGVDVELRHQLWAYVRGLKAQGTTVLLTTHYLEEAEQLCDRIAIINRSHVVACDDTAALVGRLDQKTLTIAIAEEVGALPQALTRFNAELRPYRQIVVRYRPSKTPIGAILAALQGSGITILDLTTEESNLEDIFIELTRKDGRAA